MITHFTTVLLITVLMLLQTIEGRSSVLYLIVMTVVGFIPVIAEFISYSKNKDTTLIKHLNGLLKAESGEIFFNGENIYRICRILYSMSFYRDKSYDLCFCYSNGLCGDYFQ